MNENYTGINKLFKSPSLQVLLNRISDGTFREFVDDWKWIFTYSKKYKWIIVFYTFIGMLSSAFSLAAAYVSKIMINIIVGNQTENLWFLIVVMVASTLFSMAFGSVLSRIGTKISIYVNNDIQSGIFDRIIDADWSHLNQYQNGDILNRFNGDVSTISGNAINWIPNLIINIFSFSATFIILFRMDPTMAWIAIISAPVLLILSRYIMRKLRKYKKRVLEMNSEMMSFEVETFYHFDTIKSFGVTGRYSNLLKKWQGRYKEYNLDYNAFEIRANILMTLLSTAVSMLAFGYCLYRLWTGQIEYGDMTFFLNQRSALSTQFNALVATFPGMISSAISAHRVRELVELPKERHNEEALNTLRKYAHHGLTVKMEGVSFSYQEGTSIYDNGCFEAKPNEIVAILGPSGGGKTTILRLILGLIQPEQGKVVIETDDGTQVPVNADLRALISYVPQGNSILSGTIADNLRMVKEDATEEEMIAVLKQACAWDFIEKLPDGIHSSIGEMGKGFSEGQAQRIAIARALLRDAPILLLDEATSALDMDTETQVLHNIIHQHPQKTCIVSTHRKSILSQCQRVYHISGKKLHNETA